MVLTGSILGLSVPMAAFADAIPAQPVTNINPGADANPANIGFSHDVLYFTATDKHGHLGMYAKKLTKGGLNAADPVLNRKPALVKNLFFKKANHPVDNLVRSYEVNVADKFFFHVQGDGLYTSRGTALSTIRLQKFNSASSITGQFSWDPNVIPYFSGGKKPTMGVIFTGETKKTGVEPFFSTGSPAHTKIISDINPGANGSFPYSYVALPSGDSPDQIYFAAFNPTTYYQLYRTLDETKENTGVAATVSRTDTVSDNFATRPYSLTLAGNDVIFAAGNDPNSHNLEAWVYSTSNNDATKLTNTNVAPFDMTGGAGTVAYFAGNDGTHGNEVWIASSFSVFANEYNDIYPGVTSSFPHDFKTFGSQTYFLATDSVGTHLYRIADSFGPDEIVDSGNTAINVTDYVGAIDSEGNGTIFFVGDDGNGSVLWQVDNSGGSDPATEVRTGQNNRVPVESPVNGVSTIGTAVDLAGATAIFRVYFASDGTGTEFQGGNELWVFQPE